MNFFFYKPFYVQNSVMNYKQTDKLPAHSFFICFLYFEITVYYLFQGVRALRRLA